MMKLRIFSAFALSLFLIFSMFQAFSAFAQPAPAETALTEAADHAVDCSTTNDVSELECEALVALYTATDGDNWTWSSNWLTIDSSADVCDWYGVYCESGGVYWLAFSSNNISGTLPAEFWNLTNLKYAELDRNKINGNISGIGNLTELIYFSVLSNNLTGTIPAGIGSLANLETLDLGANQISGEIPLDVTTSTSLKQLKLSGNLLTGTIPSEIGNLSTLEELRLDVNNLQGSIPTTTGNLSNLTNLFLAQNQLSGPIPTELGNLANLYNLYLSHNNLTGTIPTEVGSLSSLGRIYLNGNKLEGSIPAQLGNLTSLTELSLSANLLTGEIPAGLSSATGLRELHLNDNQLTGTLPAELADLSSLQYFYVNNNNLAGELPSDFADWSSLFYFWFFGNDICVSDSEPIMSWLENMNGGNGAQSTGLICGTPGGAISGTVTDSDSNPLSNIEVHLIRIISSYQTATESITTTTGAGQYQFDNLGEGISYTVKFVDPTEVFDTKYYGNVAEQKHAPPVTVTFGNTTLNIDGVLGTPADRFFDLNISHAGQGVGAVTSSPSGIDCDADDPSYEQDCSEELKEGTVITLTAAPSYPGHQFAGWSAPCSGTGPCTFVITQPVTITSTFDPPPQIYTVYTYLAGSINAGIYIDIQSDPSNEFSCDMFSCNADFQAGTVVTFTYNTPDSYIFDEWTDACAGTVGNVCTLTIDESKTIGANIRMPYEFDLSVSTSAEGITVTSDPAGIDCGPTCEVPFTENSIVTLTYTLEDGYSFDGWQGDCTGLDACIVTIDNKKAVTATVTPLPDTFQLTGKILDESNNPVSGATLTASGVTTGTKHANALAVTAGITTTTNANGEYLLELPPGDYEISLSKEGVTFNPSSFTASVTDSNVAVEDVVVEEKEEVVIQPSETTIYLPMIVR